MIVYGELLELMRSRRSIRRFRTRAVHRELTNQLLETARWAPSNHNRQPWKFLVVDDPGEIRELAEEVSRELSQRCGQCAGVVAEHVPELLRHAAVFAQAPLLIIVLHKRPLRLAAALLEGLENPALVSGEPLSAAMAVQNLLLAAPTLGLGACMITGALLVPGAIERRWSIPAGFALTCCVAVGYPDESPEAPRRKSLAHIAEYSHDALRIDAKGK